MNGSIAIDEQTITSPSVIETSYSGTELTVYLSKGGLVNFGSDTKMNLAFDENKVSGVLLRGSATVLCQSDTSIDIQIKGGFIKVVNQNPENNIVIDLTSGKTPVRKKSQSPKPTKITIAPGQHFIIGDPNAKHIEAGNQLPFFAYLVVSVSLLISAVFGDAHASDLSIDSSQVNVGPNR